jgi:type I restriction enzyme S subunit
LYSSIPNGACYAGYLIRARFNKKVVLPQFISYYTKSTDYINWKNRYCIQTTIPNISADKYYQLPVSVPSLAEQQRIVDYLDEKTSAIDARIILLEKKKDAYSRLKKAMINRAVTRGLDEHVKLKDSGVEWIRMIPEHWEMKRLKDISELNPQYKGDGKEEIGSYLPMEGLRLDALEMQDITFAEGKGKYTFFEDGDLLVAKVTPCFENGNIAIAQKLNNGIGFGSSEIFVLRTKKDVSVRYMFYYVQTSSFQDEACTTMCGVGGLKRISPLFMRQRILFLPPFDEQKAITAYLDDKCSKIDAAITNIDKQIDALKRLKRSLINEVITGKRIIE